MDSSSPRVDELFHQVRNVAAGYPSGLWGSELLERPLPTNAFWQNFVLNNGSVAEYIHPFLIQSKQGTISIGCPFMTAQAGCISQVFVPDFSVSFQGAEDQHVVSHFDDLSVTLNYKGMVEAPLVRGSPYVTLIFHGGVTPLFSTIHAVLSMVSSTDCKKHEIVLHNKQTWVLHCSVPLFMGADLCCNGPYRGVVRISMLVDTDSLMESILDKYSSCYPVGGHVDLSVPFEMKYSWKTKGEGKLLMLSLPLHRDMMVGDASTIPELRFSSIDGMLMGVLGTSWTLRHKPIKVGWYSSKGVRDADARYEIVQALEKDVHELATIGDVSTLSYGKRIARAARMALIAEEIGCFKLVKKVRLFLVQAITPWLNGTFHANSIAYDSIWGGLITKNSAADTAAELGFGLYNNHHYHWGYFCYASAVLAKLDPTWGRLYKHHIHAIVEDFLYSEHDYQFYPRLRNFDAWLMHSWAGGLIESKDGRNQQSITEAVNAYYAASLVGVAYGDVNLIKVGLTLAAFEMHAAKALCHVPSSSRLYDSAFVRQNRVVSILWANKRESGLWVGPLEYRLGIQVLPITPITEYLFNDSDFARELVGWVMPCLGRAGVEDGWKGYVYALQAMYDPNKALYNIRRLRDHEEGNCLSNLLWWAHTR